MFLCVFMNSSGSLLVLIVPYASLLVLLGPQNPDACLWILIVSYVFV